MNHRSNRTETMRDPSIKACYYNNQHELCFSWNLLQSSKLSRAELNKNAIRSNGTGSDMALNILQYSLLLASRRERERERERQRERDRERQRETERDRGSLLI
jgi:hypothetical protein